MSNIYKKLNDARAKLQSVDMKKSGFNSFAKYHYFELADFLPHTLKIFNELGLCGVISFDAELATLTITDLDDVAQKIVITSPMSSADLRGCNQIQNIGAVETYQRRYLWVVAMEIIEHDAIDATPTREEVEAVSAAQQKIINALIRQTDTDPAVFCSKVFGVDKVTEIPAEHYEHAVRMLQKKVSRIPASA